MQLRGVFVTGTDTGVGKTVIAEALARWYRRSGYDVGVMKPIATGGRRLGARWISEDARQLVRAARVNDVWSLVNPICFREPIAPWTAARRAGTSISFGTILRAFRVLRARHDLLIVEGVGGLAVPLNAQHTVADLAKRCGLPLVIVTRPDLGTLNHTLLTLHYAQRQRLPLLGVVVNWSHPAARVPVARLIERTNVDMLKRLARVPVYGPFPFQPRHLSDDRSVTLLGRWVERVSMRVSRN